MNSTVRNIPILDLKPEVDALWPQLGPKLEEVLRSGMFILGPETKSLESEMAEYLGVKHAIGLNSGTDALIIALRALGIGPGDEVITSPFSFFATAESISLVGAKPVFVDVELETMNIDPTKIEAAITSNTKAIMPVHLFGLPAAMDAIMTIAKKHNLRVVEDAAQSIGSVYHSPSPLGGKMTGNIGDFGCFSFYPTKNLGAYGDAGLITTNDDDLAELARKLRTHGSLKQYHNEMLGYNSRLDSVQAAILRIKLPLLDSYNRRRCEIATAYTEAFSKLSGIIAPKVSPGHTFHQYTLRISEGDRDDFKAKLAERGVGSMVYYPIPQDRLPLYLGQYPTFTENEVLSKQVLSLPIYPHLSDQDVEYVIGAVRATVN